MLHEKCRAFVTRYQTYAAIVPCISGYYILCKSKGVPRQTVVALGVPGRLRPRIISTFGITRVVGRQPYAPAAFTRGEIPGTHSQTSGHMVLSEGTTEKISSDTTGNRSRDRPTSSAAP